MHKQNTTNEHQVETITKSPESIQDVAQPLGVTSIMTLVITLPGKLPNQGSIYEINFGGKYN